MQGRHIAEARIGRVKRASAVSLDLARLGLDDEDLVVLAPQILELRDLTTLDLSGNRLTALPDSLGGLTALTTLNLQNNGLRALPAGPGPRQSQMIMS